MMTIARLPIALVVVASLGLTVAGIAYGQKGKSARKGGGGRKAAARQKTRPAKGKPARGKTSTLHRWDKQQRARRPAPGRPPRPVHPIERPPKPAHPIERPPKPEHPIEKPRPPAVRPPRPGDRTYRGKKRRYYYNTTTVVVPSGLDRWDRQTAPKEVSPKLTIELFESGLSRVDSLPAGRYAMWWAAKGAPRFSKSSTIGYIRRAYTNFSGIEATVADRLLRAVGALAADAPSPGASAGERKAYLRDDRGMDVLLTISKERGLQFQLNTQITSPTNRDLFWREVAAYAKAIRASGVRPESATPSPAHQWWLRSERAVATRDQRGDGVPVFGAQTINRP